MSTGCRFDPVLAKGPRPFLSCHSEGVRFNGEPGLAISRRGEGHAGTRHRGVEALPRCMSDRDAFNGDDEGGLEDEHAES
jgi:hypothetical protein